MDWRDVQQGISGVARGGIFHLMVWKEESYLGYREVYRKAGDESFALLKTSIFFVKWTIGTN